MDEKMTEPTALQTISVPVISTGSVGGGPAPMSTMTVETPSPHQPNIKLVVIAPFAAILIRFVNAYLTTLVGLVAAGLTSNIIPANDFMHLVAECAKLSIAGAGLGLLKDCLTVFSGLERKYPLQTGSV